MAQLACEIVSSDRATGVVNDIAADENDVGMLCINKLNPLCQFFGSDGIAQMKVADENYPVAYSAALDYYNQAKKAFDKEDFNNASLLAQKVLDTLAGIKGMNPLPKFYIVQPWEITRDCLWNISGRTYVYNNPWLWENLYEANKSILPEPENPNLILPGMKLEIPSISGEYRSGTYDPNKTYGTFSPINIKK